MPPASLELSVPLSLSEYLIVYNLNNPTPPTSVVVKLFKYSYHLDYDAGFEMSLSETQMVTKGTW